MVGEMMKHKMIYTCDNCGADIVFNPYESVKQCSYCGSISAIVEDNVYKYNFTNIIPFDATYEEVVGVIYSRYGYTKVDKYEKIYLPFCDIECDAVCFAGCEEVFNDNTDYYDVMVNGHINNFLSLCISDIDENDIYIGELIDKTKSIKYDPSISNNCEIILGKFRNISELVDSAAKKFGRKVIRSQSATTSINNITSSEYNINVKNTLVPFYKVILSDGKTLYVLAQKNIINENKEEKIKQRNLALIMLLSFFIMSFFIFYNAHLISHHGRDSSKLLMILGVSSLSLPFIYIFMSKSKVPYGTYKIKKNRKIKFLGKFIDLFK